NNTTGDWNIALGDSALYYNTTGEDNVVVGTHSLLMNTEGNRNVGIGVWAGNKITTGSDNVLIGFQAGYRQTTLGNRLIIDNQDRGSAANEITKSLIYGIFNADPINQILRFNAAVIVTSLITGGNIGVAADTDLLQLATNALTVNGALTVTGTVDAPILEIPATADASTGLITQAGTRFIHSYGTANVFIGSNSGNFTTTGVGNNMGVGTLTLGNLTTGYQNVAIGGDAGRYITSGFMNMAIGSFALTSLTTGSSNVGIGRSAGISIVGGSHNVGIGRNALV
ncbi:unnamed protein product, partial [marine sediment metagenome]